MLNKALTGFLASGLLLSAQVAFAGDHGGWQDRGYDRDRHEFPGHDYPGGFYDHEDHERGGAAYDYARVVSVDPIVSHLRVTVPRRECWTETRYQEVEYPIGGGYEPHRGAAGSMILGGILGAAIGNQIGQGDGRRAATVAGAIIGSAIGHDAADRRNDRYANDQGYYRESRPYEAQRCEIRYDDSYEDRIDGYRVTYEYNGRLHTTRLPYDPGDRIRVRVDVQD